MLGFPPCFSPFLSLGLFHPFSLSVFLAEPRSTLRVSGYWPNLFVFLLADKNVHSHCEEEEEEEE